MKNKNNKKRLMYLSGEDFYLFCYSSFIILDSLGCFAGNTFRDSRKLAFLINIINDDKLVYIIANSNRENMNLYDKEYLFNSYSNGLMKRSEILKLMFTLEKKGFIKLERGKQNLEIDVSLDKNVIPKTFFDQEMFSLEYQKIATLKRSIGRLKTLKLETMLEKIYSDKGVKTWAI